MNQRDLQSKLEQEERRVSFCIFCISKDNPAIILPSSFLKFYLSDFLSVAFLFNLAANSRHCRCSDKEVGCRERRQYAGIAVIVAKCMVSYHYCC
jgi:hypothetical protein